MSSSRFWQAFPTSYRSREVTIIAGWISAGESGTVVGLPGTGRATLLEFLCQRPDALQTYLAPYARPAVLIPVDLNNLPDNRLDTLYRVILRSFYEIRGRFDEAISQAVMELCSRYESARDPVLHQNALRQLLILFQTQEQRVVLVINRFDRFCRMATPQMISTLRGLRDSFKDTLLYVMGMRHEATYLTSRSSIGPLRAILDTYVCRVGPLNETDARHMMVGELRYAAVPAPASDLDRVYSLTGGYPSLIRVACHWWMGAGERDAADWTAALLARPNTQHRLSELWHGLTQAEQQALSELQMLQAHLATAKASSAKQEKAFADLADQHVEALSRLERKGVCRVTEGGWQIVGSLFAAYVALMAGRSRGRVWLNKRTREVYQGSKRIEGLPPLEYDVLNFLIKQPYTRHTHTDIIEAVWPEDILGKEGVSTEALYQVIRGVRKKIEPNPAEPCYLINWRGQREGGYQFFPESRPQG